MKGLIFSVKRYSVHDGPGIRVTFFMKGCPLSCLWCHNPEGIFPGKEHFTHTRRIGNREFERVEVVGKDYTVDDIIRILDEEKIFIDQSKGGVTFSGGEPMMQADFLVEALKACKTNGYHTVVDTSGYTAPGNFRAVMPFTDLFLFDIKHLNNEFHLRYTGVSNTDIISNLRMILDEGGDVMVRIPVIPGINDDKDNLDDLKEFLGNINRTNLKKINLLPYHKTGVSKYKQFNIPDKMTDTVQPSLQKMNELKLFFSETGIKAKIGG